MFRQTKESLSQRTSKDGNGFSSYKRGDGFGGGGYSMRKETFIDGRKRKEKLNLEENVSVEDKCHVLGMREAGLGKDRGISKRRG